MLVWFYYTTHSLHPLTLLYTLFMRISVLTLFPQMFEGPLTESILQRAQEKGLLKVELRDLRTFGKGRYRQVDDAPYGGGAGMVLRADVVVEAIEGIKRDKGNKGVKGGPHRMYLSPKGKRLTQARVEQLAKKPWLLLLAGHYE